jgi:hypothetical protein
VASRAPTTSARPLPEAGGIRRRKKFGGTSLLLYARARAGRALLDRTRAPQRRMAEDRRAADKEETSSFQGNILK